ncbi:hypothetical protein PoMZ_08894 [Pyricularia oryzae]|uniref:Uncharacterized protein n=1 Tax=Pyricularia oryzae TaxID=318829 RepID=A0A4P7NIU3_PYROR|nr:hypothetical protein PoMZ_08894 [Pyricularia oryzae]
MVGFHTRLTESRRPVEMHHTAAILEWKASASSRRAFVIPKEPNWPLANAGSAAEVTSPLLVIGDEHPLVLGLRVLNLTVAAVEIRRSTRLPGPDAQRPPLIFFGAAQEDGPGDSCRQSASELAARKDTGVLPCTHTHTHTHTCGVFLAPPLFVTAEPFSVVGSLSYFVFIFILVSLLRHLCRYLSARYYTGLDVACRQVTFCLDSSGNEGVRGPLPCTTYSTVQRSIFATTNRNWQIVLYTPRYVCTVWYTKFENQGCTAIVLRPSESAAHESPSMLSGNCKPGRTCRPAR